MHPPTPDTDCRKDAPAGCMERLVRFLVLRARPAPTNVDAGRWLLKNMANNYCESSSMISIPEDKVEQAKEIMARIADELEKDPEEGYVGYEADLEADGVWIRHNESINTEHAATLVRTLVEELDLPGIFVCSWSYTCSKPRIDEFGGGAFAIQKGRDTVWVDAASEALRQASISETNA